MRKSGYQIRKAWVSAEKPGWTRPIDPGDSGADYWGWTVRADQIAAWKQPPQAEEPEPRVTEQRAWFPPDFQDFETAMEVTAYALRG